MYDNRLVSVIDGSEVACAVCKGDVFALSNCEACHRTGYFAPAPNGKETRIRVVAIYEGTIRAHGNAKIKATPESYEVREWLPCCERMRAWSLAHRKARHTSERVLPSSHITPAVDGIEDWGDTAKTYPALDVGALRLKFCPECGSPIRIEIVEKIAELTKQTRRVETVDAGTVRRKIS